MRTEKPDLDEAEHRHYRGVSWIPGMVLAAALIAVMALSAK